MWNYLIDAEKGADIEIEATDLRYMHKVKKGIALAMNRRDISGIQYSIPEMKLGVFKGLGLGWIEHKLILKENKGV